MNNKSLPIAFIGEFAPITKEEVDLSIAYAKRLGAKISFLPYRDSDFASFSDRAALIKIAIQEAKEERYLNLDLSLKTDSLEDYLAKAREHTSFLLAETSATSKILSLLDGSSHIYLEKEDPALSEEENRSLKRISLSKGLIEYIHEHRLFYIEPLASFLNEKRLLHSESVALLSYDIAKSNSLPDPGKAYIAGLLHDIGKYVGEEESLEMMKENGIKEAGKCPPYAYHQFVGALLAKERFAIEDEEILEAISYHCTGKAKMGAIGEIVYSADKIDPLRHWNSKEYIDACLKDYREGFKKVLAANKEFLERQRARTTRLSEECYEYYLKGNKNG